MIDRESLIDAVRRFAALGVTPLPRKPLLPQWCIVVRLAEDTIHLRTSSLTVPIQSPVLVNALESLLPHLKGNMVLDEVIQRACYQSGVHKATAETVLRILAANAILIDADSSPSGSSLAGTIALTNSTGRDGPVEGAFRSESTLRTVRYNFENRSDRNDPFDLVVATGNLSSAPYFLKLNAIFRKGKQRWIHISLQQDFVIIGPIFMPDHGPCYQCYLGRRASNDSHPRSFDEYGSAEAEELTNFPLAIVAAQIAVSEAKQFLTVGETTPLFGHTLTAKNRPWSIEKDRVLAVPSCGGCGPRWSAGAFRWGCV